MNRAFDGDYPYSPADMPDIDCLVISHDHWDHLDHATLVALRGKVKGHRLPPWSGGHPGGLGVRPGHHPRDGLERGRAAEPGLHHPCVARAAFLRPLDDP